MKFLVKCTFHKTVMLGGLFIDDVDFTVEAPTPRIAECKVMNCYPEIRAWQVTPIGARQVPKAEKRRFLVATTCCYVVIFACVKRYHSFGNFGPTLTHIEWLDDMIYAGLILFTLGAFLAGGHVLVAILSDYEREREENAAQERECYRRLGYREGWTDSECKRTPQFSGWVAEDSKDLHPYWGPATRISDHSK